MFKPLVKEEVPNMDYHATEQKHHDENVSTSNDSPDAVFSFEDPAAKTTLSTVVVNASEIETLSGTLDTAFTLFRPVHVLIHTKEDGFEAYVPIFRVLEFGETRAEAIENVIESLVADWHSLGSAVDSELTEDARLIRDAYLEYTTES